MRLEISMGVMTSLHPADRLRLRSASIFASLGEKDFDALADQARYERFDKGAGLFLQGDPAEAFFVVLEGWVTLLRDQADGTRTLIKIVAPGESFAEALLTPGARYPVGAEAASQVRLARIDTEGLRRSIAQRPELGFAIIAATFRQLRQLIDQIEHLKSWPIERRLAAILLQMCERHAGACRFDLPVEQHLIAARLSVTPPTLSRCLKRLEPLGVEAWRGSVVIRDVDRLARFVGGEAVPGDAAEGEAHLG